MKMAVFDFALRKKGVYGVLHIIILLLSLFLVISISIDTFKNIPFYTQTSYKKIQLWICLFFLFDFVLEFFLSKDKLRYLRTHFIFLLVASLTKNINRILSYYTHPSLVISYVSFLWYGVGMRWRSWWDGCRTIRRRACLFLT